ncbi:hypothetical protein DOTSEDRAFT_55599 [Dothistroma septosporum NZE10]|uniref:F-box domain-containing protein n=1 Tax=Dothistroma septosporum (strain NZE10 / CBS 128990) TaxID=675120 RepID=N1PKR5_DOTSN|nr:hypothetical protein DOTSEDRAFT_55599 [Dothistroma septosporum NZE10]
MFSALPVELIEHILAFLHHDDNQTYAAVCRVNRLFHEIGTPRLYRSINVASFDHDERLHRLQLLIRTLSENLPLTKHVEEISQYVWRDSTLERPIDVDIEVETLQELLRRDLAVPFIVIDYLDLIEGHISEDCGLLILIGICPGVETLNLLGELNHLKYWHDFSQVITEVRHFEDVVSEGSLRTANGATPSTGTSFDTISTVNLKCSGGGELHTDIEDLESLLWLPALQRLHTDVFDRRSEPGPYHSPPNLMSRIETLEIENCGANGEDFHDLLPYCPALKILNIEWPSRGDNYRRFDWADLGNCIRENCPNLQTLLLDHPRDSMLDDDAYRNVVGDMNDEYLQNCHLPGLGSMRSLQQLQSYHVSNIALFGTHRDDSFVPADFSDSDDENEVKHCLENVLPESLNELSVLCEHQGLEHVDIAILHEAGAERLELLTIMDCQKDEWISRNHGQLTASTPELLARVEQGSK